MGSAARPGKDKPALSDLRIGGEGAARWRNGGSAHVLPVGAGSGSASSGQPPPLLLLEHGFFRGLPGWGGPGTGGAWDDAQLEGTAVAVPALRDALDVRHFDSRCVLVLV